MGAKKSTVCTSADSRRQAEHAGVVGRRGADQQIGVRTGGRARENFARSAGPSLPLNPRCAARSVSRKSSRGAARPAARRPCAGRYPRPRAVHRATSPVKFSGGVGARRPPAASPPCDRPVEERDGELAAGADQVAETAAVISPFRVQCSRSRTSASSAGSRAHHRSARSAPRAPPASSTREQLRAALRRPALRRAVGDRVA